MKRYTLAILLAACGGDDVASTIDASATIDSGGDDIDGGVDPDAEQSSCAGAVAPLAMISGTEGIAIADDGTVYFSQSGHVGRWVPGAANPDRTG